ncbi:MAG: hypothetical protein RR190_07435, partial [Bacteroidales bacterium]
ALLAANNYILSFKEEAIDYIVQKAYTPQYGARPLKRFIQKTILNEISKQILAGTFPKDTPITMDILLDKPVFF